MNGTTEMVQFWDRPSKKVIDIPASELAPGAVCVNIEGVTSSVWTLPGEIDLTITPTRLRHSRFDQGVREYLLQIQEAFLEHRPLSLQEWEDGFRCDTNPEREIAIWLYGAEVYKEFAGQEPYPARRREIYKCVLNCMVNPYQHFWRTFKATALQKREVQAVVDRFFQKQSPSGGPSRL